MNTPPLWMPSGSIRSLVALTLVAATVACAWFAVEGEGAQTIYTLAGTAVGFYFGARQREQSGG